MRRKLLVIGLGIMIAVMAGCQKKGVNIVNASESESAGGTISSGISESAETGKAENTMLNLDGYKGEMTFELEDAYVTDHLLTAGIDLSKLDAYSSVTIADGEETADVHYPEYIKDQTTGELVDHCSLFVCKIKVTNIDATCDVEDYYDSPYIFSAGNIWLNYLNEKGQWVQVYPIDYYSLRKDGDHTWSTYEVKPGESIEYEVGFVVGNAIYSDSGKLTVDDDTDHFYLSNRSGDSEDEEYYQVKWRKQ